MVVVNKSSAIAVCTRPDPKEFKANHVSIVKPTDRGHPIYAWAVEQLMAERRLTSESQPLPRWKERRIVIGGKDFIESNLLVAMMALAINPRIGGGCPAQASAAGPCVTVQRKYHIGGRDRTFDDLKDGEIDLYPEYTGTVLAHLPDLAVQDLRDAEKHKQAQLNTLFQARRNWKRFEMLSFFGFNNSYQLVVRRRKAEEMRLSTRPGEATISDLARVSATTDLSFKSTEDFFHRRDGLPGLEIVYKLRFASSNDTKHDAKYVALADNTVDVVDVYTTDPEAIPDAPANFVKLRDDKDFFPKYYAAVLASKPALNYFPTLRVSLDRLEGKVSEREISDLIVSDQEARLDERTPADVIGRSGKARDPRRGLPGPKRGARRARHRGPRAGPTRALTSAVACCPVRPE